MDALNIILQCISFQDWI